MSIFVYSNVWISNHWRSSEKKRKKNWLIGPVYGRNILIRCDTEKKSMRNYAFCVRLAAAETLSPLQNCYIWHATSRLQRRRGGENAARTSRLDNKMFINRNGWLFSPVTHWKTHWIKPDRDSSLLLHDASHSTVQCAFLHSISPNVCVNWSKLKKTWTIYHRKIVHTRDSWTHERYFKW